MSRKSEEKDSENNRDAIPAWANVNFSEIELGERIGGGGVGIIYKGWWGDQAVALKTLFDARISGDLKKEYMDELLVMSRLNHSNIVKFMGACMIPPNLCFIMELCETSLFNVLHVDRIKLSFAEKYQCAIDVASAGEYLHSLSPAIIHRDMKTHNILRTNGNCYKVCDFGLVRNKNVTAGTPAYMAPELLDNKGYNKPVDVYAFAVILWEIFSEEIPFHRHDIPDIRMRVLSGKRPVIPSYGVSPKLARLITSCWEQNPENRPTFTQIVDTLLELERDIPEIRYSDSVKDSVGDILDGMMTGRK